MLLRISRLFFLLLAAALGASLAGRATAQQFFFEDFADEALAPNSAIANVTIADGIAKFDDPAASRATFSYLLPDTGVLPSQTLTFSFDMKAPVVETTTARMEVILRIGMGTGQTTLGSGDVNAEAILFRGPAPPNGALGPRAPFVNNGNETVFLLFNNQEAPVSFTSPVDNTTQVTLNRFQYATYILNNTTTMYSQFRSPVNFASLPTDGTSAPTRANTRFGIGSSTTADVGTLAIDNVLVVEGATFVRNLMLQHPGDVDGDGDVDLDDFAPIRDNFQKNVTGGRAAGDLNNDGIVEWKDYRQWKDNHPFTPTPSGAVPEPASGLLTATALLASFGQVRRRTQR